METLPRIAVTMGDPAGIGPEIVVKAFDTGGIRRFCRPIVTGDAAWLAAAAERYAPGLRVLPLGRPDAARHEERTLEVIDLRNVPAGLPLGRPAAAAGHAALASIRAAADLALSGEVDAIATAPINKKAIHLAGCPFPGHTEILAAHTGTRDFALMMVGRKLRIVLVTIHVALRGVAGLIDQAAVLKTIRLTHQWLARHAAASPRIAVTGLNPHCGDDGVFGAEESGIIAPAIREAEAEGIRVCGPFAADSLFARNPDYDAVVVMYHDQGLIPVKMEAMGHAVNVTIGLPIVRTSVDHGTAYDIAGQGAAAPDSLIAAMRAAAGFVWPAYASL